MKTAFLYSDRLSAFDYGQSHPLKPFRLALAFELMKAVRVIFSAGLRSGGG